MSGSVPLTLAPPISFQRGVQGARTGTGLDTTLLLARALISLDTTSVNGVASSSISPIANLMPAVAGATQNLTPSAYAPYNLFSDPTASNASLWSKPGGLAWTPDGAGGLSSPALGANVGSTVFALDGTGAYLNYSGPEVFGGQLVFIQATIKSATGTADGTAGVACFDATGASVGFANPANSASGSVSGAYTLPAGTATVRPYLSANGGASGGTVTISGFAVRMGILSAADLNAAKAYIDFTDNSSGGHVGKNLDNIGNGTTYGRALLSYLSSGRPYADQGAYNSATVYHQGDTASYDGNYFLYISATAASGVAPTNAGSWQILGPVNLDSVLNGTTYAKVLASALQSGQVDAAQASNFLTSLITDDLGMQYSASWGKVASPPSTLVGYGLQNAAQAKLPGASTAGYLYNDGSGNLSWGDPRGSTVQAVTYTAPNTAISTTETPIGDSIGITIIPANSIALAMAQGDIPLAAGDGVAFALEYSTDGGSTWTVLTKQSLSSSGGDAVPVSVLGGASFSAAATDIQFRLTGTLTAGTGTPTLYWGRIHVLIIPVASSYLVGPALSASITGASGSTTVVYPTTTGTCTTAASVAASGGTPPYSYSAAIVTQPSAGTATLVNATTANPEVQLSETATHAGATYHTVIDCTVTDSASGAVTTGNATITQTFYLNYDALSASMSTSGGGCSTSGVSCTASGSATTSVSGGDGSYGYSNAITGSTNGVAAITSGATSATCTVSATEGNTTDTVNLTCTVSDTTGVVGNTSASDSLTLRFIFL